MTKKELKSLDNYYKRNYGITWKHREIMLKNQNNCCALCSKHENLFKRRLHVDHNHKSGKVRALVCYRCNKFVIGRHNIESATKLYQYMIKFDE